MTTPQETEKYFKKVVLYLAKPENQNTKVGLDDLFSFLEIPKDYRTQVYNKLWYAEKCIDGEPALKNPQIKINAAGIELAKQI